MLGSKQFYYYPVRQWIEDEVLPRDCDQRVASRNKEWFFLESAHIFSMPDQWEYPWFAAWDLAFHCMLTRLIETLLFEVSPNDPATLAGVAALITAVAAAASLVPAVRATRVDPIVALRDE